MRDALRTLLSRSPIIALLLASCAGNPSTPDAITTGDAVSDTVLDGGADVVQDDVQDDVIVPMAQTGPQCDPIDQHRCSYPWPSNRYLKADSSRATGFALEFAPKSLPMTVKGDYVNPEPWAQMDGYSVGTAILALFPNVDTSALPSEADMSASVLPASPILLLEVGENQVRQLHCFAELDGNEPDSSLRTLIVRPGEILKPATRYLVAFRNLTDTNGEPIARSEAFELLVTKDSSDDVNLADRQARFDDVFQLLEDNGVDLNEVVLAWDFVTASSEAMHGKMLHMRDEALESAPEGPEFTVDSIEEKSIEQDPYIALRIKGTIRVPHYMLEADMAGMEAWKLNLGQDGLPTQEGWAEEPVWIHVPHSALDGTPHGLVLYGHGLNGTGEQVHGEFNRKIAFDHKLIFFATNMRGMSNADVPRIMMSISDLSMFYFISDHLHQGMLNFLLLARSAREQFPTLSAFTDRNIVVDPTQLYYSGISQGGIFGATYMALSTDTTRGHLGVPGNNYSTLLQRSVDFLPFFELLKFFYKDSAEHLILLESIQSLWDRNDPVSYYRHIKSEPFANTPAHDVLLASATGDHQVALITNEVLARSGVGVQLMANYGKEVVGVEEQSFPYTGSGLVNYDYGNPWPEPGNVPPSDGMDDPHGKPRQADHHNAQLAHFLFTGEIIDVCGGDGCTPE